MLLPQDYHRYEEIVAQLKEIHQNHPDITKLISIGKTQQHQRNIYALKLSDHANISEEQPGILFSAAIHGNEILGTEVCMSFLNELLEIYNRDEKVTQYIKSLEIWLIPVINVDGYEIATTTDPLWRKNARDNDGDGKHSAGDGVDLNRNFDYNWQTGGSSDPPSKFYRGATPFSESETRAIAQFVNDQKFVFSASYHSAEAMVYYPWRDGKPGNYKFSPEDDLLTEIATGLAGRIKCINENYCYQPVRNTRSESYTTNYFYGILGTIDFIIEVGKYDYIYPKPILEKIIDHNLAGACYLLDRAMGPGLTGQITDAKTGKPIYAEVRILEYDNVDIQPRTTHPETGRYYRLLNPGVYHVLISAEGFKSRLFQKVVVSPGEWTELNISLDKAR